MFTKTVVRGGYGLFYGGEENQGGSPNRGEGIPFNQTMDLNLESAFAQGHPFLGRFSDGWPINTFTLPANISFRGVDRNFRNPLVSKWNFTIQQDLGWGSALEVSYIGSKGSRQLINWDPNTPRNTNEFALSEHPGQAFRVGSVTGSENEILHGLRILRL